MYILQQSLLGEATIAMPNRFELMTMLADDSNLCPSLKTRRLQNAGHFNSLKKKKTR